MSLVRHQGVTIRLEHPALWVEKGHRIVRDLVEVFSHAEISRDCLQHLLAQRHRLVAGDYDLPDGRGCLMFVLTEPLGVFQICSKSELLAFFGQEYGNRGQPGYISAGESPEYQPAKWLVRLIDGQICDEVRHRYGRSCEFFDYHLVIAVAEQVLAQRWSFDWTVTSDLKLARN